MKVLFFSKEVLQFFKDNNVEIYYTHSHLKAVVIESFERINDEIFR